MNGSRGVCYGSWETGYRCGACEECRSTRPSRQPSPTDEQLLGELRSAARNDACMHQIMSLAVVEQLRPFHAAVMAATYQLERAQKLERMYLDLHNTIPLAFLKVGVPDASAGD